MYLYFFIWSCLPAICLFMEYFLLKKTFYYRYLLEFDHRFLFGQVGHSLKVTWKLILNIDVKTGAENAYVLNGKLSSLSFFFQLIPTQWHLEPDQISWSGCIYSILKWTIFISIYITSFTLKKWKRNLLCFNSQWCNKYLISRLLKGLCKVEQWVLPK